MRRFLLPPLVVLVPVCLLLGGAVGFAASLPLTPKRLTVFTSASSIPISTCTLSASAADTYADGAALSQGSNFGTATQLHVRSDSLGNKRSFVRFDLSSCSIPSGARIETATVSLHLSTAPGENRTYQIRRVSASWGETTLTWSNQPGVAGSATDSASTGTTNGVTLAWAVVADVQAFVNGTANNGWRVADAAEGALIGVEGRLSSREHATASQRPSLVITYYP
ncbi:MAG: DNRLRE domain-containing protein [Gaiellaceae bacterium]